MSTGGWLEAERTPHAGVEWHLELQVVRRLVRLWVVGCAGARVPSGLQLLTDLRGAPSSIRLLLRRFRGFTDALAVEAIQPGLRVGVG